MLRSPDTDCRAYSLALYHAYLLAILYRRKYTHLNGLNEMHSYYVLGNFDKFPQSYFEDVVLPSIGLFSSTNLGSKHWCALIEVFYSSYKRPLSVSTALYRFPEIDFSFMVAVLIHVSHVGLASGFTMVHDNSLLSMVDMANFDHRFWKPPNSIIPLSSSLRSRALVLLIALMFESHLYMASKFNHQEFLRLNLSIPHAGFLAACSYLMELGYGDVRHGNFKFKYDSWMYEIRHKILSYNLRGLSSIEICDDGLEFGHSLNESSLFLLYKSFLPSMINLAILVSKRPRHLLDIFNLKHFFGPHDCSRLHHVISDDDRAYLSIKHLLIEFDRFYGGYFSDVLRKCCPDMNFARNAEVQNVSNLPIASPQ